MLVSLGLPFHLAVYLSLSLVAALCFAFLGFALTLYWTTAHMYTTLPGIRTLVHRPALFAAPCPLGVGDATTPASQQRYNVNVDVHSWRTLVTIGN